MKLENRKAVARKSDNDGEKVGPEGQWKWMKRGQVRISVEDKDGSGQER